jgi:uncharacterized membrane protein (UPF0127 family)
MNRLFSLTILASLILIAAPACGTRNDADSVGVEPQFEAEGELRFIGEDGHMIARIAIELAESSEEQAMGLMGRRSLPALGGMLFINDAPRMQHFWMKNTPLPLDIIFIRSDLTITNIVKRTRPLSADYIDSTEEAQYVLEVRAGFTDKYQIDETASIRWQRLPKSES